MSKFTNERWYTGPKDAPAYVQMSSIEGPQGGFRITRSDKADHEFANLISAAPDMYEALQMVAESCESTTADGCCFTSKEAIEMILKALAKADGKGE